MLFVGKFTFNQGNLRINFVRGADLEVSASNNFYHAKYISDNDFYFCGTVDMIATTTYSQRLGFLMRTGSTGLGSFSTTTLNH